MTSVVRVMSARVFLPSSFHVLTDGRGAAHLEVETIMPDIFFYLRLWAYRLVGGRLKGASARWLVGKPEARAGITKKIAVAHFPRNSL